MRNLLFWIVVTNLFWMETAVADNNDSQSVSVGGKVVQSLEITAATDLLFGPVAIPNSATDSNDTETSVRIYVTNQDTGAFDSVYNGDGDGTGNPGDSNLPGAPTPTEPAPAKITVNGEPNFNYAVSFNPGGLFLDSSKVIITFDNPGTQTIPSSGTDYLYIGGKFEVRNGATVGSKSGTFDVTVTYD